MVDVVLGALDVAGFAWSLPLAYVVRDEVLGERFLNRPGLYPFTSYWPLLAIAVGAWIAVAAIGRLYRPGRMRTLSSEMARAARTLLGVAAIMAVTGFMTQAMAVSRQLAVIYLVVSFGALVLNRLVLRAALRALRRRGYLTRIFAVVGTSEAARAIAEAILARREWGYHLAGYIEEEGETGPRRVGPVLGSLTKLQQILDNGVLDEIIFAVPHKRLGELEAAVLLCRKEGVTARICLDAYPRSSRLSLEQIDGIALLGLHH
jgi:FlaA1/EpsC-like NDP-sugar epimerase